MSSRQVGVPRGTRDIGPLMMAKRQFIFGHIQRVFKNFGFQPMETPAMEQLSILTGKYGQEGDQLLFKILNSGDFLKNASLEDFQQGPAGMLPKVAEKGLRYDLTVPFARYVVMNRNDITFPFRRYQMQPVWRADRPQKGRYREFYQCDADVIGTNSLLCEAEMVAMIGDVFTSLGIDGYHIQINHRKILQGIAEVIGAPGREMELAVGLDKLSKIGPDKVMEELVRKGFTSDMTSQLQPILNLKGSWEEVKPLLIDVLEKSSASAAGIKDLHEMHGLIKGLVPESLPIEVNPTLARGLAYYTGTILEVVVKGVSIGSVCGGGRYDDLTGVFGMSGVSGVGISFGVDRIYDVMEELSLFPESRLQFSQVLLITLDDSAIHYALDLLGKIRKLGVSSELYPDQVKLKKSLGYADKNQIPWVVLIGADEIAAGKVSVKEMSSGKQQQFTEEQLLTQLVSENNTR